jgi:hypothetical protein
MATDLKKLFESQKSLAARPSWVERDSEGLEVVCPLEIEGVVVEGLQFRATAKKRMPDELVTMQVEFHPAGEPGGPLARIEWRPLSTHNNKGRGPPEWQNKLIRGCHHHPFDLNLAHAEHHLRNNGKLLIAVPLKDSPANFSGVVEFVKKEFRIVNVELVVEPPWEPRLV